MEKKKRKKDRNETKRNEMKLDVNLCKVCGTDLDDRLEGFFGRVCLPQADCGDLRGGKAGVMLAPCVLGRKG